MVSAKLRHVRDIRAVLFHINDYHVRRLPSYKGAESAYHNPLGEVSLTVLAGGSFGSLSSVQ